MTERLPVVGEKKTNESDHDHSDHGSGKLEAGSGSPWGHTKADAEAKREANSEEVHFLGERFWDMLSQLIEMMWEPEQQNAHIVVIATNLFNVGIRAQHLQTMGTAVRKSLSMTMEAEWTEHHSEAFDWFWESTAKR